MQTQGKATGMHHANTGRSNRHASCRHEEKLRNASAFIWQNRNASMHQKEETQEVQARTGRNGGGRHTLGWKGGMQVCKGSHGSAKRWKTTRQLGRQIGKKGLGKIQAVRIERERQDTK
eukprot:1161949-Pelagomonas_calceolata.AAC.7